MGMLKLAAGVAVGYVLGSRAGREQYEKIASTARRLSAHPTVVQAQEKAKAVISDRAATTRAETTPVVTTANGVSPRTPRPKHTGVTAVPAPGEPPL
ncbi:hypothetical protein [Actinoplanes regularis]|uniref:YtxH-like protein n=1 Tax=Actinoplanes regularis TaxID=52697 RepID=A0A239HIY7_9ACTN|nr:hypothetical protein [Actinoplanes regularis]GIE91042.1 hypothetical protein Are01nite_75220 [Actinoplanes regularis]SNS80234.1 hypothetical protein SAMN06264365_12485 [Actinoplanes regularis]